MKEIDRLRNKTYWSEYQREDAEWQAFGIKLADAAFFLFGGIILPEYFLSTLPKTRLVHAQESFNSVVNKKVMKGIFKNKDSFYAYVAQEYGDCEWPLLSAKDELQENFNRLHEDKKALKKALNDTKKESVIWRDLYDTWYDLDGAMKKLSVLLDYINMHPSYEKIVKDAGEIRAKRARAAAERMKAVDDRTNAIAGVVEVLVKAFVK